VTSRAATAPSARSWLREAARAAAGPVICAAVLTGLLSGWVAAGGAGTLTRVRIQVMLAAVPMRAFTTATATGPARTYLTIRNLSGTPDELMAARSPIARQTELITRSASGTAGTAVTGLPVPAHGTLTLSPFGDDVVLISPRAYESSSSVELILTFRHAGQVTVYAAVTGPGAP
jgi:copper(I)-binding protein